MTHRVIIDGKQTTLTLDKSDLYSARGYQYLTPGNASSHSFNQPLQAGQKFRTGGHTYEVLD